MKARFRRRGNLKLKRNPAAVPLRLPRRGIFGTEMHPMRKPVFQIMSQPVGAGNGLAAIR